MTRIGWCPGDRAIDDMAARYPGTSAVRVFFAPGERLPPAAWSDPAWPNPRQRLALLPPGCTVIVSHKDQDVDAPAFVAAWLAHRPDVLLILVAHHEPEQQTGGDPTPVEFRASWTRQRLQVGGHPARQDGRLQLAVCYTLQRIRAGGDWRTWWPEHEADAVDLVLGDWYQYDPTAPNPWRPPAYEDPVSALKVLTDISAATGKPWGIAEIDHTRITRANGYAVDLDPTGELCAAWYRRMFAAAEATGCRVWCHFHRDHGDLTDRLPEQAALRELIAQEATVTRAPGNLLDVRRLLVEHLGPHGLESAEAGIVGDPDHRGGYHCGRDRVVSDDYSVVESSRDRDGLTDAASALDVGTFSYGTHNLRTFSIWCVEQCVANAPDTRDIREIIYSPDGATVKRWDRLRRRTAGDSSHLIHTHFSFFRDSTKTGRDQTGLFRRYLTHIGLTSEGDDMFCKRGDQGPTVKALQVRLKNLGFDIGKAGVDGDYGAATQSALAAACKAVNPNTSANGSVYDHYTMFYVDVLMARKYGQGAQGPQGPAGPAGPQGPKGETGEPGPAGVLTVQQLADELARRMQG